MQFNVTEAFGSFQGDQATVQENERFVTYAPPLFAVFAEVSCILEEGEAAVVGIIQQVTSRTQQNSYPTGVGRWEIGALDLRPISDSAGGFPWYDNGQSRTALIGPQESQTRLVLSTDEPTSNVTWASPVGGDAALQTITRSQRFTDWIAAYDPNSGLVTPLKTLTWGFDLELTFDCSNRPGGRLTATNLSRIAVSVSDGGNIPGNVLLAPSANQADGYYWYPTSGGRQVIVAPQVLRS